MFKPNDSDISPVVRGLSRSSSIIWLIANLSMINSSNSRFTASLEKLRVPIKSEEAYYEYFSSDAVNRLFDELIIDKLAISQIMLLLRDQSLSTEEMSETLGLNPSQVSRYMNNSSRYGLVRYDEIRKRYALA